MKILVNRIFAVITAMSLLIMLSPVSVGAVMLSEGDYEYYIIEDYAVVSKYNGNDTDVVIPDELGGYTVMIIAENAFTGCESIVSVEIPDAVKGIWYQAFSDCVNLEKIVIPESVEQIAWNTFYESPRVVIYCIQWSVAYNFARSSGISRIVTNKELTSNGYSYIIPNSQVSIIKYSGYETDIVIPSQLDKNPVTNILIGAFSGCTDLRAATVPASVTHIDDYALGYYSDPTAPEPEYIKINGFIIRGVAGSEAERYAFENGFEFIYVDTSFFDFRYTISGGKVTVTGYNGGDRHIVVPSEISGYPVTAIGDNAFRYKTNLISITIPLSVESIGGFAFLGCSNLKYPIMPDTVNNIGHGAFIGCVSLEEMTIPASVTNISSSLFNGCTGLTDIKIPEGVTSIGNESFFDCISLSGVFLPESVKTIGEDALGYISNGVNYVPVDGFSVFGYEGTAADEYALENGFIFFAYGGVSEGFEYYIEPETQIAVLTKYTKTDATVVIPDEVDGHSAAVLNDRLFSGNSVISEIVIPDSIIVIGNRAFEDCSSLRNAVLPPNLVFLGYGAFYGCANLSELSIAEENEWFTIADGVLFNKEMTQLRFYPTKKSGDSYEIPESVQNINAYAFAGCSDLTEIIIPQNAVRISAYAFTGCSRLADITIPESIASIDYYAFSNCENLKNVEISAGVEYLGKYSFGYLFSGNDESLVESFTISGWKGTAAETYAKANGLKFISLDATLTRLGDVTKDGRIDPSDASDVLTLYAKVQTENYRVSDEVMQTADVNKDKRIDPNDASMILSFYAYVQTGGKMTENEFFGL